MTKDLDKLSMVELEKKLDRIASRIPSLPSGPKALSLLQEYDLVQLEIDRRRLIEPTSMHHSDKTVYHKGKR